MFSPALKYMSWFYSSRFYAPLFPKMKYGGMIMMSSIPLYLVYNLPKGNIELSSGNMLPILKTNSS
tara:strand:+ start:389 stop:586 length:198 start_codon:yes stop_codon:yes gene_type:complete